MRNRIVAAGWGECEVEAPMPAGLEDCVSEEILDEVCVICGESIFGVGCWFAERVDGFGEPMWRGYVCSAKCMANVTPTANRAVKRALEGAR